MYWVPGTIPGSTNKPDLGVLTSSCREVRREANHQIYKVISEKSGPGQKETVEGQSWRGGVMKRGSQAFARPVKGVVKDGTELRPGQTCGDGREALPAQGIVGAKAL